MAKRKKDSIPPPCDKNIFEHGETFMMFASIPSNDIEVWVKKLSATTNEPIDWHFAGGRAFIKILPTNEESIDKVKMAAAEMLPELDAIYQSKFKDWFDLKEEKQHLPVVWY